MYTVYMSFSCYLKNTDKHVAHAYMAAEYIWGAYD